MSRRLHSAARDDPATMWEPILMAAGRIFAEKGYGQTSIRDIASQSGAGLSTILYHFGSKEKLFLEAIRHFTLELGQLNGIFAPLFATDISDPQLVADVLLQTVHAFLHACHLAPQSPKVIGLYMRVLSEGDQKAMQMLLDCFADVQAELPRFCRRVRPEMSDTEIAFFQQLLWSQLQYTVVSKRLILYDMKLRQYTPEYIAATAWHISISCCQALGLPKPQPQP